MTPTDEKQLHLLGHLHYAAAALASVMPLFGAGYGTMRLSIALDRMPSLPPTASQAFGWIPPAIGLFALLSGVMTLGANLLTAHALQDRTHRTLCLLTAVANLVQFPLGTLLGAFSLLVLGRPAVRAAFAAEHEAPGAASVVFSSSPTSGKPEFPPAARAHAGSIEAR